MRFHVRSLLVLAALALAGCSADRPLNPSFPLTLVEARSVWRQMEDDPKALARPVVVLGGIYDPGIMAATVAGEIRDIAADETQVMSVPFMLEGSFDRCARKLIEAVEAQFPSEDEHQTVEVDVIGFSMGGLVARFAASDQGAAAAGKRLQIARLFTIGTPHRGAQLAVVPTFDKRVIDMRAGSAFLNQLNGCATEYEILPYVRLGDLVIGASNAAPPGRDPWWLGKSPFGSHVLAGCDRRILADIARRLRGEAPFATVPAAPLPSS